MRKFLAIIVCKMARLVGAMLGKGSSMPGKIALKICPDILKKVALPENIIAVTGSNGKTSTVEMIASVLKASGKSVTYNAEGSNQIEGVATMVLSACTLGGRLKSDVLLIESDERYAKYTFSHFSPTLFVITNLYRDQLTRNGHPEWVFDAISDSISEIDEKTTLVLNADDPLTSLFAGGRKNKIVWFGMDKCDESSSKHTGMYNDNAYCPICRAPMVYDYYHYNHIGAYRCTACDFKKHDTDFTVTDVDLDGRKITVDSKHEIALAFNSIYNLYNILAAYSACCLAGVPGEEAAAHLSGYIMKSGRVQSFMLGSHSGMLLTSKHENSISYDMSIRYAGAHKSPFSVMFIVDAVSRKYFTAETSWLWDINFGAIDTENTKKIYLCGKYAYDLATRFSFTDIDFDKIEIIPDIEEACKKIGANGSEDLFVITCFSDRDKLLSQKKKKKEENTENGH